MTITKRHHIPYTGFALWTKLELELRSRVVGPFQRVCIEMSQAYLEPVDCGRERPLGRVLETEIDSKLAYSAGYGPRR